MLWFRFCISVYIIIASSSWDQNKPELWCIAHTTLIISINQDFIFFIINYYFCLRDGKNLQTLALSDPNNCCLRYPQGGRRRWTTLDAPTSSTTTTALHSGNGLLTCMLEQALVWSKTPKKTNFTTQQLFKCLFPRDVISETENDNQQQQIHQEAHRVFRSRRHISEDLENEHMEPRDLDNVRENNIYLTIQRAIGMHYSHTIARKHHYRLIAVSHLCICSPGSWSQKRILMRPWPSLSPVHPPSWRRNIHIHLLPRSSLKT